MSGIVRIEYFYDVISPYSAFCWRALRGYRQHWGNYELVLRPMFLGGVMQATGNKPPAMVASRGAFQADDLRRNASLFGVPLLQPPSNFFSEVARSIIGCQRLLIAAQMHEATTDAHVEALTESLTRNVHLNPDLRDEENALKIDEAFIAACLSEAGFSKETSVKLGEMTSSAGVKEKLKRNTEEAVERGAFGSPTMFITPKDGGNEFMVFGSDRFEQIAFACGLPYLGANPSSQQSRL